MKFKVYAPSGGAFVAPAAPAKPAAQPVRRKRRRSRALPKFARLDVIRARLKRCVPRTPEQTARLDAAGDAEAQAALRLAEPAAFGCPAAVPTPSGRCKCSVKGCGCSDLHALRADAKCPLGRWSKI